MVIALVLVGISIFVSNSIVSKVSEHEREKARQWADAIKKRIELVRLTNNTFSKLRDNERAKIQLWMDATIEVSSVTSLDAPMSNLVVKIISENHEIPVILIDNYGGVNGRNLGFDTSDIRLLHPDADKKKLIQFYDDSLLSLSELWKLKNAPIGPIEVYEGIENTIIYNDTKEIIDLEHERDSLIQSFNGELINNKSLVPVLLVDEDNSKVIGTNIEGFRENDLKKYISNLASQNNPVYVDFGFGQKNILYYDNSPELKQLQYFPYIQFIVIGLFAFIAYLIFSTFRKAEQNQVWAGMAKETAHQLGTPLSSLMAWIQLLESQGVDPMITGEMQKDIDRLETITDRFSKIGSDAKMDMHDISETVRKVTNYLRLRISDKVELSLHSDKSIMCRHNPALMEWVVENISKNAVDAMEGKGSLTISISQSNDWVNIDIRDTGKGIPANQFKTIFQPGFSTKKRGWGLGLSLVKRIVKEYHKGRVFVLESQVDVGTTFRISLPL